MLYKASTNSDTYRELCSVQGIDSCAIVMRLRVTAVISRESIKHAD